jgi:hypothetical protein
LSRGGCRIPWTLSVRWKLEAFTHKWQAGRHPVNALTAIQFSGLFTPRHFARSFRRLCISHALPTTSQIIVCAARWHSGCIVWLRVRKTIAELRRNFELGALTPPEIGIVPYEKTRRVPPDDFRTGQSYIGAGFPIRRIDRGNHIELKPNEREQINNVKGSHKSG